MLEEAQVKIDPEIAKERYLSYLRMAKEKRTAEDELMMQSYRQVAKGNALLSVDHAMKVAGANEDETPRLAFARADWIGVSCHSGVDTLTFFEAGTDYWHKKASRRGGLVVATKPDGVVLRHWAIRAVVPHIPPGIRPAGDLSRYWIAWEVEEWSPEPPYDPLLLSRINAGTFAVLAAWDLTEVERMVLRGTRSDA